MTYNGDAHDALKAMAPGYVLLALDLEEQRVFTAPLPACPECKRAVAEMRAILDVPPDTVAPREPPDILRRRLLADARSHGRPGSQVQEAGRQGAGSSGLESGAARGTASGLGAWLRHAQGPESDA